MRKNRKKYLKLEYQRKRLGLKQADMAVLLGVTDSCYGQKERGYSPFSFDEVVTIHEALNKKVKKLGEEKLSMEDIFLD